MWKVVALMLAVFILGQLAVRYVRKNPLDPTIEAQIVALMRDLHAEIGGTLVQRRGLDEVDFDAVLTALSVAGYAGPVCFELSRGSHRAPELVQRCQQLWQRIRR